MYPNDSGTRLSDTLACAEFTSRNHSLGSYDLGFLELCRELLESSDLRSVLNGVHDD